MQNGDQTGAGAVPVQFIAGLAIGRNDAAVLARLLDDLSGTLGAGLTVAGGLLARANIMIASMLQMGTDPPTHRSGEGGMSRWQARQVRAQIDANMNGALPVQLLAKSIRLSTSHFSRLFSEFMQSLGLSVKPRHTLLNAALRVAVRVSECKESPTFEALRIEPHTALGDGVSFMSPLVALMRDEADHSFYSCCS